MLEGEWPLEANGYEFFGGIGKGAFSNVCRACRKSDRMPVAIKIMDLENISTSFEDILQEVQTMRLSDDENILRCYCSFVESDQLWLVTQLMDKGSCLRVMNAAKQLGLGEGMNEDWLAYILKESLQGLNYLHNNGQIHRDIKSGNILLDSSGCVRLADFGVSGWSVARGQRHETVKTFVGTPCYMAPEVMEQADGYDNSADVWSIGITALELAKGYAPYAHYSPMKVLILTIEEEPPSLSSYPNNRQRTGLPFSSQFEDFYKKCLQKNPRSRHTADQLLRHKFLKSRSKDALVNQLLNQISSVGRGEGTVGPDREKLPGEAAISIERCGEGLGMGMGMGMEGGTGVMDGTSPSADTDTDVSEGDLGFRFGGNVNKYVAGTTWTFDLDSDGDSTIPRKGSRVLDLGSRGALRIRMGSNSSGGDPRSEWGSVDSNPVTGGRRGSDDRRDSTGLQDFLTDFESDVVLGSSADVPTTVNSTSDGAPQSSNASSALSTDAQPAKPATSSAPRTTQRELEKSNAEFLDEFEAEM